MGGTIPDMTSDTSTYVALQHIFQQQAVADLAAVQAHLQSIATLESLPLDLVSPETLRLFCKNAHDVSVHSYRSLEAEYSPNSVKAGALTAALDDENGGGAL